MADSGAMRSNKMDQTQAAQKPQMGTGPFLEHSSKAVGRNPIVGTVAALPSTLRANRCQRSAVA